MDILQYLIELLKNRKQIGIEGLGTLYKKKTPGRYDAETHSFLPPSYTLQFKAEVLENANLTEYIQNKRGVSEDSAKYFISQFVEDIKKALQNGDYEMENLGTFSKLGEELIFIPDQNINTGFDFFALPPIDAQLLPQKEEETVAEQFTDVEPQSPSITAEETEQVQLTEVEEINKVEHHETLDANLEEIEKQEVEEPVVDSEEVENEEITESNEINEAEDLSSTTNPTETEEPESDNTLNSNETTHPEVVEEIAEVDTTSPIEKQETAKKDEQYENLTWDFNNESVVSEEDINKEEVFVNDHATAPHSVLQEEQVTPIFSHNDEETEDVKLKSTIHEWDFNNIEKKKAVVEENTLIGEFDQNNFEEELIVEKTSMPLYQKIGFGLIALLILIVVLYFVKPSIFENFQRDTTNPDEKLAVPIQRSNLKTQKDSISFADSIMKNAERVGLDVLPARDTLEVTTSKKEVPTTYTFDIIIASFATDAKAQEYIARMKKKGFDAKLSTMHGKRKNISIATYNNIDSAQKYVTKFRKQFKNEDIYAQPIKNK